MVTTSDLQPLEGREVTQPHRKIYEMPTILKLELELSFRMHHLDILMTKPRKLGEGMITSFFSLLSLTASVVASNVNLVLFGLANVAVSEITTSPLFYIL